MTLESKPEHPAQATYDAKAQLRQDAFLTAYAECGTIASAATAIGLTASAVYDWKKADRFGFLERFSEAQLAFGEKLEDLALKRVENLDLKAKGGSDILLIAMLNANKPDKWRRSDATPNVGVVAPVTQIIINLAPGVVMPESLKVVEGESREVEDSGTPGHLEP